MPAQSVENQIKTVQKINFNRKYPIILLQFVIKILLRTLAIVLVVSLIIYTQSTIYDFPKVASFSGENIFNPYQNVSYNTVKANFHAHSKAWAGLTNGHNSPDELVNSYHKKGYTLAGISNYFKTDSQNVGFQVYEHGINIIKAHCLAINPKKVSYFDFPFFQNTSHKQQIINNLKHNDALVVLAHPSIRGGHNIDDMRELVGYNFTEVLNHYTTSEKEWDAALQAGKLSWIMANDDTHDIHKEPTHQIWNEIFTNSKDNSEIIKNISEGKSYGIKTKTGFNDLKINYLQVENDSVYFDFGKNTSKVSVIIDGKDKIEILSNNGRVHFAKNFNYIRFVAESANAQLFTNPLVRCENEKPLMAASLIAPINYSFTTIERLKYFSLLAFLLLWVNRKSLLKLVAKNQFKNNLEKSPIFNFLIY